MGVNEELHLGHDDADYLTLARVQAGSFEADAGVAALGLGVANPTRRKKHRRQQQSKPRLDPQYSRHTSQSHSMPLPLFFVGGSEHCMRAENSSGIQAGQCGERFWQAGITVQLAESPEMRIM